MTDKQLRDLDMWASQDLSPGECEEVQTLTDEYRTLVLQLKAAQAQLAATERELERWKHGQQVEGDYICPDSLALTEAKSQLAAQAPVVDVVLEWIDQVPGSREEQRVLDRLLDAVHTVGPDALRKSRAGGS